MDILALLRRRAREFRCPMCRRSLADCKLRQLDHQGPHYTVEVTCTHCDLAFLVSLEVTDGGQPFEAEPEVVEEEVFEDLPQISNDELLQVHEALRNLRGPLSRLLQESPSHD